MVQDNTTRNLTSQGITCNTIQNCNMRGKLHNAMFVQVNMKIVDKHENNDDTEILSKFIKVIISGKWG